MNAGRLKHRLQVEEGVETQTSDGELVPTWTAVGTVWAAIEPIRGRESTYAGEQILGEMDTRVIVRWSRLAEQISTKHRLTHQGTLFNVVSVAHIKLGQREIEIMCKQGVNDG